MRVGVAEARQRFRELLDRVIAGESVEIARRETVIAVLGPPRAPAADKPISEALLDWRRDWDVDSWPDDGPFDDVRDLSPGREAPW